MYNKVYQCYNQIFKIVSIHQNLVHSHSNFLQKVYKILCPLSHKFENFCFQTD